MRIINPMETLLISKFLCPDCKPVYDALLDGTEPEFIPCAECAKKIKSYEDYRDCIEQQYKSDKEERERMDPKFKEYVDKYCKKHNVTVETALTHKVVKEVKKQYEEG